MKHMGRILVLMVAALVIAGLGFSSVFNGVMAAPVDHSPAEQIRQGSTVFTQIYTNASPSVVAISVSTVAGNRVLSSGTGSGFVVDQNGHIVTNNHVVDGATQIEIEFTNGMLAWAEVVGLDPDSDLAVLRVNVPPGTLVPIAFGDSNALQVGETVLAIGSPFGQDWTLTTGIVSGLDRTIRGLSMFSIGGVIQTDAAINPGNSGGPLLNLQGQVIGVNSQIATNTSSNSGVGFAVPGNLARRVVQDLIANGRAEYSYIGITGNDINLTFIDALGLPANTRGIAIGEVVRGGPAERAGLQTASNLAPVNGQILSPQLDIITAINGYPLKGMDDLISYLARETLPGQVVRLTVLRNANSWLEVDVLLAARP